MYQKLSLSQSLNRLRLLLLLGILTLSGQQFAYSQTIPDPIFSSTNAIANLSWSNDGRYFVFQDLFGTSPGVLTPGMNSWNRYDTLTDTLSQSDSWPLQPSISAAQEQAFQVARTDDNQISFMFLSPNGRYIVYAANRPATGWELPEAYPLAIADLQSGIHVVIDSVPIGDLEDFNFFFNIKWSQDSSAFIMQSYIPEYRLYYIDNFENSLSDYNVQFNFYEPTYLVEGELRRALIGYDLSDSGDKVLTMDSLQPGSILWVWDTDASGQNQTVTLNFIDDAIFSPNDENKIWYINQSGFFEVDLSTGQEMTLDQTIKTDRGGDLNAYCL